MPVDVVIQGERGGYSEQAAHRYFDEPIDLATRPTYLGVVQSLDEERCGIVPIENTVVGTFAPVAELLMEQEAWIAGEVVVPLPVPLAVPDGGTVEGLERGVAFPELLDRCHGFIEEHGLAREAAADTAGAARVVAERADPATGALVPPLAAKHYGLTVLDDDVQDPRNALGRLLVLRRFEQSIPDGADKTTLAFVVPDRPGTLHEALEPFARREINLIRIDGRPISDRPWHYAFHVDLDGAADDPAIEDAVSELARRAADVKLLGSYRRAAAP